MVDISDKTGTVRTAVAEGLILLGTEAFKQVAENTVRKGDVLGIAQIAGIMGAKETSRLIPLCHQLQLTGVDVELTLDESRSAVNVRSYAKSMGPTGVEMEALTAVSVACLTIYDMCKSISKQMEITSIHLVAKTGGQSGDFRRSEED